MPKLKHLELQGYKTFASRTEFLFDEGITAIVGPNGSGKSNIADAIRWALGEQSFRTLRGRQTEDMIFHGSEQRPRLGMASVTLTLDNSEGWLPTEFAEVAISRRAYRSGENEYLLNNTRVRLRDILELLAPTGLSRRTYTVIGQGLVDAALSLRPEERRTLFEEAAGIAAIKDKRQEAVSRLEETQANLLRVRDIINEITPRLLRLEEQAQRAREAAQAQADLRALLRTWHGYRWQRALQALNEAQVRLEQAQQSVQQQQAQAAAVEAQINALQERQAALRQELSQWQRQSGELHRQAESVQRELAVRQERSRLLGQRLEEIERELAGLRARQEAQAGRVAATEAELAEVTARWQGLAAQVAEAQERLQAQQAAFRQQQAAVERLQETFLDLAARLAEGEQQRQQLEARRQQVAGEKARHEEAHAAAQGEIEHWTTELAALAQKMAAHQEEMGELEARRRQQREALAAAEREQAEARERLAAAGRAHMRLQDRLDLLRRLQEEGEGYAAGVRALLQAGIGGILGPVAECLRVPPRLERAVEAALGSRLQDLVVERWTDAEAAIGWLRREGAGRATLLPLDSLRPPEAITAPQGRGILGLASDLVEADERLRPAVHLLLGRTLIVEDLATARRVLETSPIPLHIATLDGEIVHSDGRISGGSGEGSVLARERERRELPARLQAAAQAVEQAEAVCQGAAEETARCRTALDETEAAFRTLFAALEKARAAQAEAQRPLDLARQRATWHQDLAAQAADELIRLHEKSSELAAARELVQQQEAERRSALAEAQQTLMALDTTAQQRELAALQAEFSLCEGQREGLKAVLAGQQETLAQIAGQIRDRQAQASALSGQQTESQAQIAAQLAQAEQLTAQVQEIATRIAPAEAESERWAAEQAALESQGRTLQMRLRQEEARANQALLTAQRRQDELEALYREIESDLGPVEVAGSERLTFLQPPLPLPLPTERLPLVQELPQGVDGDIRRLRGQLRRLGSVNPDAPAEYEAALDRHRFLTTQAADLEKGAQSLREVIAELDRLMEQEFERTFQAVAAQFKEYFTALFGGGTARLELTDPDDLTHTGVEIVARPPGKRAQSLALLSGGERSLTAIALIFAILKVSPTPFCVLDEVDAMLDEANVGRFRSLLKELAESTQFVVITHNRGTIEAADTIYGVSMGADSVSQVVSLKLHGEQMAR
ncbi:MAG: chromosome segregation protein SMC [Anaerolineae bacterium]|nr:chromosome segregation protein SMC [Anaerolineae bacterium]